MFKFLLEEEIASRRAPSGKDLGGFPRGCGVPYFQSSKIAASASRMGKKYQGSLATSTGGTLIESMPHRFAPNMSVNKLSPATAQLSGGTPSAAAASRKGALEGFREGERQTLMGILLAAKCFCRACLLFWLESLVIRASLRLFCSWRILASVALLAPGALWGKRVLSASSKSALMPALRSGFAWMEKMEGKSILGIRHMESYPRGMFKFAGRAFLRMAMGIGRIASLLETIVCPQQGERIIFLADYAEGRQDALRAGRQRMAQEWHQAATLLCEKKGCKVLPLVKYREVGKNNAELPKTAAAQGGGHVDDLPSLIASANIAIAMTQWSASAPLKNIAARAASLRVVSMPQVDEKMEAAMGADYVEIELRGKRLLAAIKGAVGFELTFAGELVPHGTRLYVDTRANNWILDSGMCRKTGDFINFPSGELFSAPYEGVSPEGVKLLGESKTSGVWPVYSASDRKVVFLKVEKNRIIRVQGDSALAKKIIEDIAQDENNANVAEIAFGLNESARSGEEVPVLEKEKAGPHVAYGRNDHFGSPLTLCGKVKASVHQDFVYTMETPITVTIYAVYPNGKRLLVAQRGKVVAV